MTLSTPNNLKAMNIVPGGQNIGIEIKPGGLIVTGTYDVKQDSFTYNPANDSDINKGDIIYKANSHIIKCIDDFTNVFKTECENSDEINLGIKRNGKYHERKLKIITSNGRFKTGLFVKERILGIGTVSFYDEETKMYGALGHEITDSSNNEIIDVDSGSIYESTVTSIKPSINANPGEKIADISFDMPLGDVAVNTPLGIYGQYEELPPNSNSLPLAEIEEVKLGTAELLTVVNGNAINRYQIEITNLKSQSSIDTKGITFKVTDPNLLNKTNGIVAGMSGSPIIQNNKIVGAVTHVIVDNVTNGYAVYMKWMVETAKDIYIKYYK